MALHMISKLIMKAKEIHVNIEICYLVIQNPINAQKKLNNEIHWGEWLGHFAINLFQICVVLR